MSMSSVGPIPTTAPATAFENQIQGNTVGKPANKSNGPFQTSDGLNATGRVCCLVETLSPEIRVELLGLEPAGFFIASSDLRLAWMAYRKRQAAEKALKESVTPGANSSLDKPASFPDQSDQTHPESSLDQQWRALNVSAKEVATSDIVARIIKGCLYIMATSGTTLKTVAHVATAAALPLISAGTAMFGIARLILVPVYIRNAKKAVMAARRDWITGRKARNLARNKDQLSLRALAKAIYRRQDTIGKSLVALVPISSIATSVVGVVGAVFFFIGIGSGVFLLCCSLVGLIPAAILLISLAYRLMRFSKHHWEQRCWARTLGGDRVWAEVAKTQLDHARGEFGAEKRKAISFFSKLGLSYDELLQMEEADAITQIEARIKYKRLKWFPAQTVSDLVKELTASPQDAATEKFLTKFGFTAEQIQAFSGATSDESIAAIHQLLTAKFNLS